MKPYAGSNPLPRLAASATVETSYDPVWPQQPRAVLHRTTQVRIDLQRVLADLERETRRLIGGARLD